MVVKEIEVKKVTKETQEKEDLQDFRVRQE